jgi:Na+/H+ antiporter NhaD/arsenite permease-like protein
MDNIKTIALVLFLALYAGLLIFPKYRTWLALSGAVIFVILGISPFAQVTTMIDFNVLMMIGGTMGIVALFIESKMPAKLADILIDKMPDVRWAVIVLAFFAGVISAFVDNVATVLMVAPVAMDIARKLKISPVNMIIAIAVASNLQGAATLVGDTTSILLGGYANMNFLDFFVYQGRPGLFWIVQLGAVLATATLLYVFRNNKEPIHLEGVTEVKDMFPTYLLLGMITLLIFASFIENRPAVTNGFICMLLMGIGLLRKYLREQDFTGITGVLLQIDGETLGLLTGLFVVIGGISAVGVISDISKAFVLLANDNVFVIYTLLVWGSVFFSAFIDNIPYVATMLPVVASIAALMNVDPTLLYFGLLTGATLGGNLTPIGASANITAIGILRKAGYEPKTSEFMKIGVPFTLIAVTTGYIVIYLLFR